MLHNFILNASDDSKQAGASGPWQLIKENNSGMALLGEHLPLVPFAEATFIYCPQSQEIKTDIFNVIGHFVFPTSSLHRLTFSVITKGISLSLMTWGTRGIFPPRLLFIFLSSPCFIYRLGFLRARGWGWVNRRAQKVCMREFVWVCHCGFRRVASNWIDKKKQKHRALI